MEELYTAACVQQNEKTYGGMTTRTPHEGANAPMPLLLDKRAKMACNHSPEFKGVIVQV